MRSSATQDLFPAAKQRYSQVLKEPAQQKDQLLSGETIDSPVRKHWRNTNHMTQRFMSNRMQKKKSTPTSMSIGRNKGKAGRNSKSKQHATSMTNWGNQSGRMRKTEA